MSINLKEGDIVRNLSACNMLACLSVVLLLTGLVFGVEASTTPDARIEDALAC